MLSYRHAFHAGNFADVLKHAILTLILDHMANKDKGFSYIDTHAGAGMYRLTEPSAQKTGEYLEGIGKLWNNQDLPPELVDYIDIIHQLNEQGQLKHYPGSPAIAERLLRRQDAAFLYDLHPAEHRLLQDLFINKRKFQVFKADGFQGLKGHLPPATRRAVVLTDPPYELKTDYHDAVATLIKAYKPFSSGTYVLWYPVVQRHYIDTMEQQFRASKLRNILQLELSIAPDNDEYGMTGSGLFIVNPPWVLEKQAENLLPYLVKCLAPKQGSYRIKQLIAE